MSFTDHVLSVCFLVCFSVCLSVLLFCFTFWTFALEPLSQINTQYKLFLRAFYIVKNNKQETILFQRGDQYERIKIRCVSLKTCLSRTLLQLIIPKFLCILNILNKQNRDLPLPILLCQKEFKVQHKIYIGKIFIFTMLQLVILLFKHPEIVKILTIFKHFFFQRFFNLCYVLAQEDKISQLMHFRSYFTMSKK